MSDDGVVAEKRSRGRPKANDVCIETKCFIKLIFLLCCILQILTNDKEVKETKKRGRPSAKPGTPAKADKKIEKESENGEPVAKRGRGRPKKAGSKSKPKVSKQYPKCMNATIKCMLIIHFFFIDRIIRKRTRQATKKGR